MTLIAAAGLSKAYGHVRIFQNLRFELPPGGRLGIVGANGVGKTTLLRLLAGEERPDEGQLVRARGLRLGYLPQETGFSASGTVWQACESVFAGLKRKQAELERLAARLQAAPTDEAVLARYGELEQDFERAGGYTYQTRIRQVLQGLGFSAADEALPVEYLSGGQRTRLHLAVLLLQRPDVLLLDEPTNHLDMAAVEWLENYLLAWTGGMVIVSHDRYFLDKVCNRILEMTPLGAELYRGNYSHYLKQREERWQRRQKLFAAEKEKLERELAYIKKNIEGQNVNQARGRLRRLSRRVQAIEQAGVDAVRETRWSQLDVRVTTSVFSVEEAERRVAALRLADPRPPRIRLRLRTRQRSGDRVLRTHNLQIGYPQRPLFHVPDLELWRGETAALLGPNGAGKSTFLKTLLGQLPPLAGEVETGASLQIGYFAQAHEDLVPENTLIEEIRRVAPQMFEGQIRSYLAQYLFRRDEVYKKVAVLSGGERGRLALAKLALQEANLLLLDEPTNHLDIPSQEILQEVLERYEGTIILVSHDRYLVDALATQIWHIDSQAERMEVFAGTYSQLLAARAQAAAAASPAPRTPPTSRRRAAAAGGLSKNERLRLEKRLAQLENEIANLEDRQADLSARLSNAGSRQDVPALSRQLANLQTEYEALLAEWEKLAERLAI